MKNIFLFFIFLVAACSGYAQVSQLLLNENFTGYATGDLNNTSRGQGSWKASFGNNSAGFVQVANTTPLMYPDYTSGTQYINVKQKITQANTLGMDPDDPSKSFGNGIIPVHPDNTTFFVSFLVRVPSAAGVATIADAQPNVAIHTINGGVFANFYIGIDEGGKLRFGINKDGKASGKFAAGSYKFNTTYLIVIQYDVANGDASPDYDDKMYLWVNPSLAAEPSPFSADVAIDQVQHFDFDGGFDAPAESLQLFQEANSATASFDAFRVAYAQHFNTEAANDAAAWNALSPAGTPLPVALSDFNGYIKHGHIELDWRVNFEFNMLRYEIERSTDGAHYTFAGTMTAKNDESESSYKWIDAFPNAGNNYYRIKNVFKTGNPVYSPVVRLSLKDRASLFTIYPNPLLHGDLFIRITDLQQGDYAFELFNAEGQALLNKQIKHPGGSINQAVVLPPSVRAGIYTIQLTGNGFKQSATFVVQ